jgi:hypothetical protein
LLFLPVDDSNDECVCEVLVSMEWMKISEVELVGKICCYVFSFGDL